MVGYESSHTLCVVAVCVVLYAFSFDSVSLVAEVSHWIGLLPFVRI